MINCNAFSKKCRDVNGDASETAILKCMESINGKVMAYRSKYPKVCEVPFNSSNKYQVKQRETEE
jgi:sodium/potassium-transporting ATPase subunit alpha